MIPTLLLIGLAVGLVFGTRWTLVVAVGIVVTFAWALGLATSMDDGLGSVFREWIVAAVNLIVGGLVGIACRELFGHHHPRSALHY